jgi:deoxycytidine triphosphate deaminase
MKITQYRQKIYADNKRTHTEFKVGDHVYLWVKPKRSSLRMGTCAKLEPHYCGPFEVLERVGPLAYRLAVGMFTGRVCLSLMARSECARSMEKQEQRKLRRISTESHAVRRCAPGTRLTHCQSSREIVYSGS